MNRSYEQDKCQCQAMTQQKKRCARIATHSAGGKVLCEKHHQMAIRDRIVKKEIDK